MHRQEQVGVARGADRGARSDGRRDLGGAADRRPRQVAGHLTVTKQAKKLGVLSHRIYDRIRSGVIRVRKDKVSRTYLIPDIQKTLRQFRKLLSGKLQSLRI